MNANNAKITMDGYIYDIRRRSGEKGEFYEIMIKSEGNYIKTYYVHNNYPVFNEIKLRIKNNENLIGARICYDFRESTSAATGMKHYHIIRLTLLN